MQQGIIRKGGSDGVLVWLSPVPDHHSLYYFLMKSFLNTPSLCIHSLSCVCMCAEGLCACYWWDLCTGVKLLPAPAVRLRV